MLSGFFRSDGGSPGLQRYLDRVKLELLLLLVFLLLLLLLEELLIVLLALNLDGLEDFGRFQHQGHVVVLDFFLNRG